MHNLHKLTATDAVNKIKCGKTTCIDLAKDCLDHINNIDKFVHAWVLINKDYVFKKAKEIDDKIKNGINPGFLPGIPIGVKDNFNTHVLPTQMGSSLWSGFTPENDARAIFNLRMNGAIVMGKTVTAEFAVHTPNGTINPHNSNHITGTSSSGSAAAVATFMVPIALASQTAGSIIRPSSFCGVYGFKPSFGIVPRTGILKTTDSLDTVGLMARNNEDVRLAFDSLREYGADYPYIYQYLEDPKRQTRTNRPWRIALIKTPVRENESPAVKQALNKFANDIIYNNILVEEVELPSEVNKAHDVHKTIYDKTLSYYFQSEFAKNKDEISDIMIELIKHGRTITLNDYKNALKEQYKISKVLDGFFEKHDIILVPSTSTPAPKLGEKEKPDTSLIWTFCGNPTLSVPQFKTSDELPYGLQVVARKYNDYLLLNFVDMLREEHHIIKDITMMPKYLEKSLKVTAG